MYCTNCGKQKPDTAAFCPFCGAKSADAAPPPTPAQEPPAQQPQRSPAQPPQMGFSAPPAEPPKAPTEPPTPSEPVIEPTPAPSEPATEPTSAPSEPATEPFPPAQQPRAGFVPPPPPAPQPQAPQPEGEKPKHVAVPKAAIYAAIGVALVLIGLVIGLLVGGRSKDKEEAAKPAKTEAEATAKPTGTPRGALADEDEAAEEDETEDAGGASGLFEDEDMSRYDLPKPGDGEKLYFGKGRLDGVGAFRVAFVLSEDGSEIHDVTLFANDMELDVRQGGERIEVSGLSVRVHHSAAYPVGSKSTRIDLGDSEIRDLVIKGDTATALVDYVYVHRSGTKSTEVPLGQTDAAFEVIEDRSAGGKASAGKGESAPDKTVAPIGGGKSGSVSWENKSYRVTLGDFGTNDEGKTTVEIQSPGIGSVLPFRNNKVVIPLQCAVVIGGKTVEWNRVSTAADALTFEFDTADTPDEVIVYAYGGRHDDASNTVRFDGATGSVLN